MNYITIEARTYEEAVKKAHQQYGDRLRIHSRRDKQARGFLGLGVSHSCEITCFLADDETEPVKKKEESREVTEKKELLRFEQEAKTPDPRKPAPEVSVSFDVLTEPALRILEKNDFSHQYIQWMKGEVVKQLEKALPAVPSQKDVETTLADRIIGSADIDYADQANLPHYLVMLGLDGSGKTTTMAKIAALFADKHISLVSLSNNPATAEQLAKLGTALNRPYRVCSNAEEYSQALEEFSSSDVVLIDTDMPDDLMSGVFSSVNTSEYAFVLTVPATMKYSDLVLLVNRYKAYNIKALAVTMLDKTGTIGNIISISRDKLLPLLFFTDGKRIPRDLKRASASLIAEYLKGFSIDISTLLQQ